MNFLTSIQMAIRNILGNKLRAFLTMLGIIIGVSSVIVLVSIGQGSSKSVAESVNSLGTNLLTVNITNTDTPFTMDNISAVKKLNHVKAVAPVLSGNVTVMNGENSDTAMVAGSTAAYQKIKDLSLAKGRFISDIDTDYRQKVVVLGSDVATELFENQSPLNQKVLINGESYKVIGVLNAKGGSMGQNSDSMIMIPFSTAQRLLKTTHIQQFYVQADNKDNINLTMNLLNAYLNRIFGQTAQSASSSTTNFTVVNQQDVLDTMSSVSKTMTMLLGGIASISLLVGGIGIMNIMFVSVTERTKEIGIRKAIGAKRRDILVQFLIESVVISMIGGLIGVGLGCLATQVYASVTGAAVGYSFGVMAFAFLFSAVVGIVFGVFPANKASKLRPIEALHFE